MKVEIQSRSYGKQSVMDKIIEDELDKGGTVLIIRPEGNEIRPNYAGRNHINMRLDNASEQRTETAITITDK